MHIIIMAIHMLLTEMSVSYQVGNFSRLPTHAQLPPMLPTLIDTC